MRHNERGSFFFLQFTHLAELLRCLVGQEKIVFAFHDGRWRARPTGDSRVSERLDKIDGPDEGVSLASFILFFCNSPVLPFPIFMFAALCDALSFSVPGTIFIPNSLSFFSLIGIRLL